MLNHAKRAWSRHWSEEYEQDARAGRETEKCPAPGLAKTTEGEVLAMEEGVVKETAKVQGRALVVRFQEHREARLWKERVQAEEKAQAEAQAKAKSQTKEQAKEKTWDTTPLRLDGRGASPVPRRRASTRSPDKVKGSLEAKKTS